MVKKKKVVGVACFLILITVIYFVIYKQNKITIKKVDVTESVVNTSSQYAIDEIEVNGKIISISGWIVDPEVEVKRFETYVLLKNETTQEYFKVPTMMKERADLNQSFNNGIEHKNSGFFARGKLSSFQQGDIYRVYLWYKNNDFDILIDTGKVI